MHSEKSDLLTNIVLSVFRANGRLIDWGDKFSAEFELTSARWQMLGAIALSKEPLTAPQIALNMGVSRQGAQKQLNLLVQDNLLTTLSNPYHKKSPRYALTATGERVYKAIDKKWLNHVKKLCAKVSKNDLVVTDQLLALLINEHIN